MDKLKMQTANKADENFKKLAAMFPNAVTETIDENGEIVRAIDKDVLMQEINTKVVDGKEERYQFTWPDKKKSVLLANAPISKTLRPCREESVDFDTTENLYIEGDNLEVLKLLQETYLGKIKMIYIDPPYNTGNDFVYEDDFAQSAEEYLANSGQFDEDGNRMVQNTESNGRFHTDWLNMIYPRLRLAKDLLSEDGVIFISIDDGELDNLRKACNDVFGASNFVADLCVVNNLKGRNDKKYIARANERLLFSKEEMTNKIDLHHLRALRAQRMYRYYLEHIQNEKGYREQLISEIKHTWEKDDDAREENGYRPKRWKDCKVNGNYVLRGHNRELALKNGLPVSYDRLALLAVSVYHLAHWRQDVTVANYLLAI